MSQAQSVFDEFLGVLARRVAREIITLLNPQQGSATSAPVAPPATPVALPPLPAEQPKPRGPGRPPKAKTPETPAAPAAPPAAGAPAAPASEDPAITQARAALRDYAKATSHKTAVELLARFAPSVSKLTADKVPSVLAAVASAMAELNTGTAEATAEDELL